MMIVGTAEPARSSLANGRNRSQHCWVLLANNVASVCTSLKVWTVFKLYATSANIVWFHAKRRNMLGPTMLLVFGQQCWVRLHGPLFPMLFQNYRVTEKSSLQLLSLSPPPPFSVQSQSNCSVPCLMPRFNASLVYRSIQNFSILSRGKPWAFDEIISSGAEALTLGSAQGGGNLNPREGEGRAFEQRTKLYYNQFCLHKIVKWKVAFLSLSCSVI